MELILVMFILGMSAMIAVPMMAPFARGRKLGDSAGQLLALTQYAQDKAMAQGTSLRLIVDAETGAFSLEMQDLEGYAEVPTGVARGFSVGEGVTLAWEGASDAATQGYIQFDADGGHDVATLKLTGSDGQVMYVGTSGPTEGFRIVTSVEGGSQ